MGFVSNLGEYVNYCQRANQGEMAARSLAGIKTDGLKEQCEGVIQVAYSACGALCHFLGQDFPFPAVAVANDKDVTEESRETLRLLIAGLKQLGSA
jgi:hypothetical protein